MKSIEAIELLNARGRRGEVSAEEWARFRIEMTRRELHRLLAAVEMGTDAGRSLCVILENAIEEVEMLAEDAAEMED